MDTVKLEDAHQKFKLIQSDPFWCVIRGHIRLIKFYKEGDVDMVMWDTSDTSIFYNRIFKGRFFPTLTEAEAEAELAERKLEQELNDWPYMVCKPDDKEMQIKYHAQLDVVIALGKVWQIASELINFVNMIKTSITVNELHQTFLRTAFPVLWRKQVWDRLQSTYVRLFPDKKDFSSEKRIVWEDVKYKLKSRYCVAAEDLGIDWKLKRRLPKNNT